MKKLPRKISRAFQDGEDYRNWLDVIDNCTFDEKAEGQYRALLLLHYVMANMSGGPKEFKCPIEEYEEEARRANGELINLEKKYGLGKAHRQERVEVMDRFNQSQKDFCYFLASLKPWGQKPSEKDISYYASSLKPYLKVKK